MPHRRGLLGHSDADVGMHALTDAIYGALAAGDIGRHFPPSDPAWKGAASGIFLAHAGGLAAEQGYRVSNADVTLVCENPKIGPHAQAMAAELARILGVAADRSGRCTMMRIGPSLLNNSHSACRRETGTGSHGVKDRTSGCRAALPASGCARHTIAMLRRKRLPRNGC